MKTYLTKYQQIKTITLLGLIFLGSISFGQIEQEKKKARKANRYYTSGNIKKAKELYSELANAKPDHLLYNYRCGVCFYNIAPYPERIKSIKYFENAKKSIKGDTIPEVYYYLANGYQTVNRFEDAIECYTLLKTFINNDKSAVEEIGQINVEIERCKNGIAIREISKEYKDVKIENLGGSINSQYPDYSPVILPDGSLLFTSKREGKTTFEEEFYEDIYIANPNTGQISFVTPSFNADGGYENSIFNVARNVGKPLNSKGDDASVAVTPDGKELYIYRDNLIMVSKYENGNWSAPVMANDGINWEGSYQSSISFSPDGNTMFLISEGSEGSEGLGGKDIYKLTKKSNGSWGDAENLGSVINTGFDEESPFMDSDGTLYFSSQGHNSMGGFDIFKTRYVDGAWTKPENLGLPFNSGANDIFYVMNKEKTRAYYSSLREGGKGEMDLYSVTLVPVTNFYASIDENGTKKPAGATIKVINSKNPTDTMRYNKEANSSLYELYLLPNNSYKILVESKNQKPRSVNITVPAQAFNKPFYQEVSYEPIKDVDGAIVGQKTTFYNAFMDIESAIKNDPELASVNDKLSSYSKAVRKMDPNSVAYNFDVFSFNEYNYEDIASANKGKVYSYLAKVQNTNNKDSIKTYLSQVASATTNDSVRYYSDLAMKANDEESMNFYMDKIAANIPVDSEKGLAAIEPSPVSTSSGQLSSEHKSETVTAKKEKISGTTSGTSGTQPGKPTIEPTTGSSTAPTYATTQGQFKPVMFDFDRSMLRDEVKNQVDEVFVFMSNNGDAIVEVVGHTDAKGSDTYNRQLSLKRAQSVVNYLIKKGISAKRLKAIGMGEEQPIAPNENPDKTDNPDGRKLNRRVEFNVLSTNK